MRVRKHLWRKQVAVRIDPEHGEVSTISFVQIGERRQVDATVSAEHNNPVRLVKVDASAGVLKLAHDSIPRQNPVADLQRLSARRCDGNFLHGSVGFRGEPVQQSRAKHVRGIASALPLWKE